MSRYQPVTVYVARAKLERQARRWARKVEQATGTRMTQPLSAYVRYLIGQDASKGESK